MEKRAQIKATLSDQGLLPLFYEPDLQNAERCMASLYEAGLRTLEFTNRGDAAIKVFAHLRKIRDRDFSDLLLGAGTIKDSASARHFLQEGADFLISPGLVEEVFDEAYSEKILWIPGCMTISEILKAESLGLDWIKLFPANLLGPSFIGTIREIFPGLKFLPTGGIGPQEAGGWMQAGAAAVGMGSRLIFPEWIRKGQFSQIAEAARQALAQTRSNKTGLASR